MACYAHNEPMATVWTYYGLLFAVTLMIDAAGCVINDMWDKDLDALVCEFKLFSFVVTPSCYTPSIEARTRTRPLPAGDVSMFQASVLLTIQVALIVWLLSHLNGYRSVVFLSPPVSIFGTHSD
jgi:4-hydroxybenzoate polyprenyltransferase